MSDKPQHLFTPPPSKKKNCWNRKEVLHFNGASTKTYSAGCSPKQSHLHKVALGKLHKESTVSKEIDNDKKIHLFWISIELLRKVFLRPLDEEMSKFL